MDFTETLEQGLLREGVRRFAAKAHPFKGGRPLGPNAEGRWKDVAANGWTALGLDEKVGGMGASPVEVAIVLEEFGRGLVVEPFVSCYSAGGARHRIARRRGPPRDARPRHGRRSSPRLRP